MEALKDYIGRVVLICARINMPVPWTLPSGAIISESYLKSKELKIRPFGFVNGTYTFRVPVDSNSPQLYDLVKQRNSTMPNLIHSLDATSIALIYEQLKAFDIHKIYTIHDCFVTTANNVDKLVGFVKGAYTSMYSDTAYLENFDKHVKSCIEQRLGRDCFSKDYKYITYLDSNTNRVTTKRYPQISNVIETHTCVWPAVIDMSVGLDGPKGSNNLLI